MVEKAGSNLDAETLAKVAVIVLFGATGAGKSTFANIASGKTDMAVGHGIKSCTTEVAHTAPFIVDKKPVVLVDCPGFDDSHLSDVEILNRIAGFLTATYKIQVKITGLLYLHRITDNRFGGADRRNFRMFRKMCGTDTLKNVVIVTNMWSQPPEQIEIAREAELRDGEDSFQHILAEGAQIIRHLKSTRESAHDIIRLVLDKVPVVPSLPRQIIDDKMPIDATDAGKTLGDEITSALRQAREEIAKLKADLAQAKKENDEKWRSEIEATERKANSRSQGLEEQIRSLKEGQGAQQENWQKTLLESQEKYFKQISEMDQAHREQVDSLVHTIENQDRSICIIA